MSGKGGKGKGKSRGATSAQRRSLSRNTTPASTTLSNEHTSELLPSVRITYDEIIEKYLAGSSDSSSIPTSTSLVALKSELLTLNSNAKGRSITSDKLLREICVKIEQKKADEKEVELELENQETQRKAEEQEDKQRKLEMDKKKVERDRKKKDKGSSGDREEDSKRPLTVGAHQPKGQGPDVPIKSDPATKNRKGKRSSPPSEKPTKQNTASPAKSRSSDPEHQPVPDAPYIAYQKLDDDSTIYEIPQITESSTNEDKLKAYGVTSFPQKDLTDLGPGEPPEEDYSKAKPANQVAMNTFNSYVEPYFRPFSEEDLGFLRERGDKVAPYLMPTLGKHYSEVWAEEDGIRVASPTPASSHRGNRNVPKGNPDMISDEILEEDSAVSCGPLLSRIMAHMLPEDPDSDSGENGDSSSQPNGDVLSTPQVSATTMPESQQPGWKVSVTKSDYHNLEDRIKREMRYIGFLGLDDEPDWKNTGDDEVSQRLRELQGDLKEQSVINGARKARIAELLKEQLAYQEYSTILEDLDKQVEQAYTKRTRNMKASKKKKVVPNGVGVAQARVGIGEAARTLMERRKRWQQTIAPVFDSGIGEMPKESIFVDMDELTEKERNGVAEEE